MNYEEKCECGMSIPRGFGYYNYNKPVKCFGCGRINQMEKDKVWKVKCIKCGGEMEACDGFEPIFCANCVFGGLQSKTKQFKTTLANAVRDAYNKGKNDLSEKEFEEWFNKWKKGVEDAQYD